MFTHALQASVAQRQGLLEDLSTSLKTNPVSIAVYPRGYWQQHILTLATERPADLMASAAGPASARNMHWDDMARFVDVSRCAVVSSAGGARDAATQCSSTNVFWSAGALLR